MSKRCSKCNTHKSLTCFYKSSASSDGHRPECKDCHKLSKVEFAKRNPVKHKCNLMAGGILKRTVYDIDKSKNKSYKENNIKSEIGNTYTEISDYLFDNFYDEIKLLLDKGKNPSVDRIESSKNYSPDNIRIIELHDNVMMGVQNAIKKTSKPVKAIKDGEITVYDSISHASRELNLKRDTILAHLDKGTICKKGYRFESIKTRRKI